MAVIFVCCPLVCHDFPNTQSECRTLCIVPHFHVHLHCSQWAKMSIQPMKSFFILQMTFWNTVCWSVHFGIKNLNWWCSLKPKCSAILHQKTISRKIQWFLGSWKEAATHLKVLGPIFLIVQSKMNWRLFLKVIDEFSNVLQLHEIIGTQWQFSILTQCCCSWHFLVSAEKLAELRQTQSLWLSRLTGTVKQKWELWLGWFSWCSFRRWFTMCLCGKKGSLLVCTFQFADPAMWMVCSSQTCWKFVRAHQCCQ